MAIPNAFKLENKSLSFPYINKDINTDPMNRLIVDIIELKQDIPTAPNLHEHTSALKNVFGEHYPQYHQYLTTHQQTKFQEEIDNYYETILTTNIEYKYKVDQFGYIYNTHTLKESFGIITKRLDLDREIFCLHKQLKKYKYNLCDITSAKPKLISTSDDEKHLDNEYASGWIIESLFTPINGTIELTCTTNTRSSLRQLLNWKICREDYLLREIKRLELEYAVVKKRKHKRTNVPSDYSLTDRDESTTSYFNITDNENDKNVCYVVVYVYRYIDI
eukprot:542003_1